MNDIAKIFNEFFVNVGPDLARKIPDPGTYGKHLSERNSCSLFFKAVDEKEYWILLKHVINILH